MRLVLSIAALLGLVAFPAAEAAAASRTVHMHAEIWNMRAEPVQVEFSGPYLADGIAENPVRGNASSVSVGAGDDPDLLRARLETGEMVSAGSKDRIHSGHTRHFQVRVSRDGTILATVDAMMKINLKGVRECHLAGREDPAAMLHVGFAREGGLTPVARTGLMVKVANAGVLALLTKKYGEQIAEDMATVRWEEALLAMAASTPGATGTAVKGITALYTAIDASVNTVLKGGPDTGIVVVEVLDDGAGSS